MLEKIFIDVSKKILNDTYATLIKKVKDKDAELLALTDEFGSVSHLLKYYIEPKCQNINPANYDDEEPDAVVSTPIFEFLNNYFNREFVVQHDGRNQLFILSDAGLGKTSLLLLIKLCDLLPKKMKEYDLERNNKIELLKLGKDTVTRIKELTSKDKTILLLDAFDEDSLSWEKPEKRLIKILQLSSGFRRVIITCRTQFFPEKGVRSIGTQEKISIRGYVCPIIFLSPFDEMQVEQYLLKRFPSVKGECKNPKIIKAKEILKNAKSLRFRPFLLSHIEDLLESSATQWNELNVYTELVSVWIRREVRKEPMSEFNEDDLFLSCSAIAVKMQEKGTRFLTKGDIDRIIKTLPEIAGINRIEYGSKSLLNRTSNGQYRFSHFSIQEYFLAWYIKGLSSQDSQKNRFYKILIDKSQVRLTFKSLEFLSYMIDKSWTPGKPFVLNELMLNDFDFSNRNINGCSFKKCQLQNTNFQKSNIQEAYFYESNLRNANFTGANCYKTDFKKCSLEFSNFQESNLNYANFQYANLQNANINNSDCISIMFQFADLTGVNIQNIKSGSLDNLQPKLHKTHKRKPKNKAISIVQVKDKSSLKLIRVEFEKFISSKYIGYTLFIINDPDLTLSVLEHSINRVKNQKIAIVTREELSIEIVKFLKLKHISIIP